jgi:hypothetical protein
MGREFFAVPWNNGAHLTSGAGYGIKISVADRNMHMKSDWKTVDLYLPDRTDPVSVNIDKPSFWSKTCRELISREIGDWMLKTGIAPWQKGAPPKLRLTPVGTRKFQVTLV